MNNFMPSSPASQATSSFPSTAFTPPDEIINETLISLFYLTSEGGFMGKDTRIINHREQDGKVQIELVINGYSFWMDAKEISLRLNQMQQRRLMSDRTIYFISDSNGNKEKTLRKVAIKDNLKTKQLSHKEADNGIIQSAA
ncbi:hypothetical protein H1K04_003282 [Salmonella enterica]|nr:hypothetical protein [Salmonella enterica]